MHFNKGNGYFEQNKKGRLNGIHRFVMEEHIGRQLTYNEVVHHINHDKRDNRIENLVIMTRSEHAKYHAKKVNPIIVICANCRKKKLIMPNKYRYAIKKGRKNFFCNKKCSGYFYGKNNAGDSDSKKKAS